MSREEFEKETGRVRPHYSNYKSIGEFIKDIIDWLEHYALWLQKRNEWVSVEDRLPGDRCLVYTDTDDKTMEYRIIPKGLIKTANDATHWRPLPIPPDEAKRGKS